MTTEIKLSGKRLEPWLNRKEDGGYSVQTEITIAILPDKTGFFDTKWGRLGLEYGIVRHGGEQFITDSPVVRLSCEGIKVLQSRHSKHRLSRLINIIKAGTGCQQLSKGVDLSISTGVDLEKYRRDIILDYTIN